jgi:HK97 gp10 family phage protein
MADNFEVTGFEEISRRLEAMGRKGAKIEGAALIKSAEPMLEDMKRTSAFSDRTGKLRESLKMSRVKIAKDGRYIWLGDIDREAPYSWYLEFGTARMPARPFMRTVWEVGKFKVFEKIKDEMEKELKKIG